MSLFYKIPGSPGIYHTDGKQGQGKSLDAVNTALTLFDQYKRIEKKYPNLPHRTLFSNIPFSDEINEKEARFKYGWVEIPDTVHKGKTIWSFEIIDPTPIPGKHLIYWHKPSELYDVRDSDILWDEISRHLPSDKWGDTPEHLRSMFAYVRKRGLRIFSNSQDYKMVDINYRRQMTKAFKVEKKFGSKDISVSLPPVKNVWGLIMKREFDPLEMEHETDPREREELTGFPQMFFVTKRRITAYNTRYETAKHAHSQLIHMDYICPDCGKTKTEHLLEY